MQGLDVELKVPICEHVDCFQTIEYSKIKLCSCTIASLSLSAFRRCSFVSLTASFLWSNSSATSLSRDLSWCSPSPELASTIAFGACLLVINPFHSSALTCMTVTDNFRDNHFFWFKSSRWSLTVAATSTMILDTIGSSHAVLKLVHQRIGCSAWCWGVYCLPRSQSKTTRRRTWAWSCNQNFVHMWFSLSSLIPSIWGIANEFCLHTPSSDTNQLALSSLSTDAASSCVVMSLVFTGWISPALVPDGVEAI